MHLIVNTINSKPPRKYLLLFVRTQESHKFSRLFYFYFTDFFFSVTRYKILSRSWLIENENTITSFCPMVTTCLFILYLILSQLYFDYTCKTVNIRKKSKKPIGYIIACNKEIQDDFYLFSTVFIIWFIFIFTLSCKTC